MKQKRFKNILFSCDDKGGVGKSTVAASVADAALHCGYSVRLIDGDIENRTLFKCYPERAICLPDLDDFTFQDILVDLSQMTEDLAIVDLPGHASSIFRGYFADNSPESFREMDLRIIIATTVCETTGALEGTKIWLDAFGALFEFIVMINEKDTRKGKTFDLASYPIGSVILDFCEGHQIRIPCLPPILKELYDRNYGAPSDFYPRGRLVNELKLIPICTGQWSKHRNPTALVAYSKYSARAIELADDIAHTLESLAIMLNLPKGVRMANRGKEVLIVGPASEFRSTTRDGETTISLSRSVPDLDCGESIDDNLQKAKAGKLSP